MISLKKWLGRGDDGDEEVYEELTLETMKVGYLVDYDLATWEVVGRNSYDYDGFITREWELKNANEVRFLELAVDDAQQEWTLTRASSLGDIQEDVLVSFDEEDEPPETLTMGERTYAGVESDAGVQRREGGSGDSSAGAPAMQEREFVSWSYESDDDRLLYLVRWGERDVSVYEGHRVEAYQFTDILPGGNQ